MSDRNIHVHPDLETLSRDAAAETVRLAQAAPEGRPFTLVLSGGSTPRRYHELLATVHREAMPWERVHVFWGDERFVPPEHGESNYRMAEESLLRHVPIPPEQVHRVPTTGVSTPEAAAVEYERRIRAVLPDGPATFDLTILGLGDDGHTASLFPGTPVLAEAERWVAPGLAPEAAAIRARVTLTYPAIDRSRRVFFLVAGERKRTPLRAILDGTGEAYPASRIRALESVDWFVDEAAYAAGP